MVAANAGSMLWCTSVDEPSARPAGFSDATFASDPATQLGPQQKREHLHAFVQQQVRTAHYMGLLIARLRACSTCLRSVQFVTDHRTARMSVD